MFVCGFQLCSKLKMLKAKLQEWKRRRLGSMEEIKGSPLSQVQSIDTSVDGVLSTEEKKLRIKQRILEFGRNQVKTKIKQ